MPPKEISATLSRLLQAVLAGRSPGLPGAGLPPCSCCPMSLAGRSPWEAWPPLKTEGGFPSSAAGALSQLHSYSWRSVRHVFSSASLHTFGEQQFCGFCGPFLGETQKEEVCEVNYCSLLPLTLGLKIVLIRARLPPLSVLHSS